MCWTLPADKSVKGFKKTHTQAPLRQVYLATAPEEAIFPRTDCLGCHLRFAAAVISFASFFISFNFRLQDFIFDLPGCFIDFGLPACA